MCVGSKQEVRWLRATLLWRSCASGPKNWEASFENFFFSEDHSLIILEHSMQFCFIHLWPKLIKEICFQPPGESSEGWRIAVLPKKTKTTFSIFVSEYILGRNTKVSENNWAGVCSPYTLNIEQRKYPDKCTYTHTKLFRLEFRIEPPCCPRYKGHLRWKTESKYLFKNEFPIQAETQAWVKIVWKTEREGWRGWDGEMKGEIEGQREKEKRRGAREIWRRF